jgi:hypothetical protein
LAVGGCASRASRGAGDRFKAVSERNLGQFHSRSGPGFDAYLFLSILLLECRLVLSIEYLCPFFDERFEFIFVDSVFHYSPSLSDSSCETVERIVLTEMKYWDVVLSEYERISEERREEGGKVNELGTISSK